MSIYINASNDISNNDDGVGNNGDIERLRHAFFAGSEEEGRKMLCIALGKD
jgi:hypothetical protein